MSTFRDLRVQPKSANRRPEQLLMEARQSLEELRDEQWVYRAALKLLVELAKRDNEFDVNSANPWVREIAAGIRHWPRQWNRERKQRG